MSHGVFSSVSAHNSFLRLLSSMAAHSSNSDDGSFVEQLEGARMDKAESRRLHLDWWEKCRTCNHWGSSLRGNSELAHCLMKQSPLYGNQTASNGHCPKWDSFDLDTALEVLDAGS